MNLQAMIDNAVSPPVMADALFHRFHHLEQREIAAGGWPFQYAFIARDEEQPRLVVLFGWGKNCWRYQAHSPVILRTLRLCND